MTERKDDYDVQSNAIRLNADGEDGMRVEIVSPILKDATSDDE